MKKSLLIIISQFLNLYLRLKWIIQYLFLVGSAKITNLDIKIKSLELSKKKILIIIPHADDELIGCYQLLKFYNSSAKLYYFGLTGSNNKIENKNKRLKEIRDLCDKTKLNLYVSDGHYLQELELVLTEFKPDYIAIPSMVDWHYEHRFVNIILNEAISRISFKGKICLYQVSVPISHNFITHCISMTKHDQLLKWRMFEDVYRSQKIIPISRFRLQEKLTGKLVGAYAAEAYYILEIREWIEILKNIESYSIQNNLNSLYYKINNIVLIRTESEKIFRQLKLKDRTELE